ncbi:hypothetical protein E4U21_004742 [Claviceps maximensis]|nr:hypothetical protein E4U21_004742 [Claviceps maximensis]
MAASQGRSIPAPTTPNAPSKESPIDQQDVHDWTVRLKDVLARPKEIVESRSAEGSQPWHCLLFCAAGCIGLHWIPLAMQRMNIREKYSLRGSCIQDLALSCCCHCCVLIQSDKEAEHREKLLEGSGVQKQYKGNTEEMKYPPGSG